MSQKNMESFPLYSGRGKGPIDVWGVCVSRDIFGIVSDYFLGDGDLDINYFRATSFIVQTTGHAGPDLAEEDFYGIETAAERFSHRSSITGALRDYNKTLMKEMSESGSEWLIVDGRVETYGLYRIQYADGGSEYMSAKIPDWVMAVSEVLSKKGVEHEVQPIGTGYPGALYRKSLSAMADFLKGRYGDKIILVEAEGSEAYLDEQCRVRDFKREESQRKSALLRAFEDDFVRATGCRRLRQPRFIVSDFFHKWGGPSPVHYVEEYYWYAFSVINLFVGGDADADAKADSMYEECSDLMMAIRDGTASSISNVLGWCRRMIDFRRYKEASAMLRELSDAGEPRAMAMLGEMKMRGLGTLYDTKGSVHLYASAVRAGYLPASDLLFDLVSGNGPYRTAFSLVRKSALQGRKSSMARLAIAFLEGRGTEKNVKKAAHWFDKAVEGGDDSDRHRLFDVIWKSGGEASEHRMVSVVAPFVDEDREAKVRMGMAYQKGRGVSESLSEASKLFRDAAGLGKSLGACRLFDVVWSTRSSDQYQFVADLVRRFADSGDPESKWRLGRAYRFGKGVEKDLERAAELCRDAWREVPDAADDIAGILWDEGTLDAAEKMKSLVSRHIPLGETWAYRRLSWMCLRGRGVERSVPKALKYARIAAEDKTTESYESLLDVLWDVDIGNSAKESLSIIVPRAEAGEGWAVRRLALMHLYGRGVDRDVGKATGLLREAVDKGSIPAYANLSAILWESDDEGAVDEMARIADFYSSRGEGWAYRIRGRMFRHGVGAAKDLGKAEGCIRAAVEANDAKALPDLCDLLSEIGTKKALKEMAELSARYAALNEPWALNRLANALLDGRGVEKDAKAGVEAHLKAIEQGSAESARDLYVYARSVRRNDLAGKAVAAVRRSAEGGDPDCMMLLGRMHWEGEGVPYDKPAAMGWMKAAASLRRQYRQEYEALFGKGAGQRRPSANVYLCNPTEGRGCAHVQEEDRSEDPRAFHRSEERLRVADRGALRQQAFPEPLRGIQRRSREGLHRLRDDLRALSERGGPEEAGVQGLQGQGLSQGGRGLRRGRVHGEVHVRRVGP